MQISKSPIISGYGVVHVYVVLWVLVCPCQLFARLWYRVSDVLDLSLMSKRFGFWPHITHVIVLTFKEIKHLSDYRTVGLSDCRIIGRTPNELVTESFTNQKTRLTIVHERLFSINRLVLLNSERYRLAWAFNFICKLTSWIC